MAMVYYVLNMFQWKWMPCLVCLFAMAINVSCSITQKGNTGIEQDEAVKSNGQDLTSDKMQAVHSKHKEQQIKSTVSNKGRKKAYLVQSQVKFGTHDTFLTDHNNFQKPNLIRSVNSDNSKIAASPTIYRLYRRNVESINDNMPWVKNSYFTTTTTHKRGMRFRRLPADKITKITRRPHQSPGGNSHKMTQGPMRTRPPLKSPGVVQTGLSRRTRGIIPTRFSRRSVAVAATRFTRRSHVPTRRLSRKSPVFGLTGISGITHAISPRPTKYLRKTRGLVPLPTIAHKPTKQGVLPGDPVKKGKGKFPTQSTRKAVEKPSKIPIRIKLPQRETVGPETGAIPKKMHKKPPIQHLKPTPGLPKTSHQQPQMEKYDMYSDILHMPASSTIDAPRETQKWQHSLPLSEYQRIIDDYKQIYKKTLHAQGEQFITSKVHKKIKKMLAEYQNAREILLGEILSDLSLGDAIKQYIQNTDPAKPALSVLDKNKLQLRLETEISDSEKTKIGFANYLKNGEDWNKIPPKVQEWILFLREQFKTNAPVISYFTRAYYDMANLERRQQSGQEVHPIMKGVLLGWIEQTSMFSNCNIGVIKENFELYKFLDLIDTASSHRLHILQSSGTSEATNILQIETSRRPQTTKYDKLRAGMAMSNQILDTHVLGTQVSRYLKADIVLYWYNELLEKGIFELSPNDIAQLLAKDGDKLRYIINTDLRNSIHVLQNILIKHHYDLTYEERGAIYARVESYEEVQKHFMQYDNYQPYQTLVKSLTQEKLDATLRSRRLPGMNLDTIRDIQSFTGSDPKALLTLLVLEGLSQAYHSPRSGQIMLENLRKLSYRISPKPEHHVTRSFMPEFTDRKPHNKAILRYLTMRFDDTPYSSNRGSNKYVKLATSKPYQGDELLDAINDITKQSLPIKEPDGKAYFIQIIDDKNNKKNVGVHIRYEGESKSQYQDDGFRITMFDPEYGFVELSSLSQLDKEWRDRYILLQSKDLHKKTAVLSTFDASKSLNDNKWKILTRVDFDILKQGLERNFHAWWWLPHTVKPERLSNMEDTPSLQQRLDAQEAIRSRRIMAASAMDIQSDVSKYTTASERDDSSGHSNREDASSDTIKPTSSRCQRASTGICAHAKKTKSLDYTITDKSIIMSKYKNTSPKILSRSKMALVIMMETAKKRLPPNKFRKFEGLISKVLASTILQKKSGSFKPSSQYKLQRDIVNIQKGKSKSHLQRFYNKGLKIENKIFGSKLGSVVDKGSVIWGIFSVYQAFVMCSDPGSKEYKEMNCHSQEVKNQLAVSRGIAISGLIVGISYQLAIYVATKINPIKMAKISPLKLTGIGAAIMTPFMIYGIVMSFQEGTVWGYINGVIQIAILIASFIPGWGQVVSVVLDFILFAIDIVRNWERVDDDCIRGRKGADGSTTIMYIVCYLLGNNIIPVVGALFNLGWRLYAQYNPEENYYLETKNIYLNNPETNDPFSYEQLFLEEMLPNTGKVYYEHGYNIFIWYHMKENSYTGCTAGISMSIQSNSYTHIFMELATNSKNQTSVIYGSNGMDFLTGLM